MQIAVNIFKDCMNMDTNKLKYGKTDEIIKK